MTVSFCCLRVVLNVLVGFSCAIVGAGGQPPQLCNPSQQGEVTKPIPQLPKQFSATVEANILSAGVEISLRHYSDGNRGRIDVSREGNFGYIVYNYDSQEAFLLPDRSSEPVEECVVRRLAPKSEHAKLRRRLNYGWTVQNGSVFVRTMPDGFSGSRFAVYMGNETVRGIPCDHWHTCAIVNSGTYTIDYYFSNDMAWTSAYGDDPAPVQLILNGSRVEAIYSYIAFNAGPESVPDEVFKIPTGVSCKGRTPGQPLPVLPNFFSTYIETVDENEQIVYVGRVSGHQVYHQGHSIAQM